jgi:anti-sigma factor (TIGR02949 family)
MTDCGCDKAKAELEEYLRRELSERDFQDVSDHLATCEDCSAEHLLGITLTQKVQKACQEKAPEELRDQVLLRLRQGASAL